MHRKVKNTFDTYAAATCDKQLFLNEIIDGADASFDLRAGIVKFGKHQWRCQVMGIQPDDTERFQWIWSVEKTEIPGHLQKWAHAVREIGVRDDIGELLEGESSDPDVDGHFLSVMATGICQANAYFCGEYQDGTVFLLIRDAQYPVSSMRPLHRFLSTLPEALQQYPVTNHRRAVTGLARFLGLNIHKLPDRILIDDGDAQIITTFDDDKRLLNLSRISRPITASNAAGSA